MAFVAYPEAIAQMPFAPFWAAIFFLTLIFVAIDSQFGMFDTLVSGVFDVFPSLYRWKVVVTGLLAAVCFSISLILCTDVRCPFLKQPIDSLLEYSLFHLGWHVYLSTYGLVFGLSHLHHDRFY